MFFLLRMAFWLGLVLVLLPTDKTLDTAVLPQIGTKEALSAAGAVVSDMSHFCTRQPATCEVGGQAATVIGHRAQAGARKVYQIITEKKPEQTEANVEETIAARFAPANTLSPGDLKIKYRAPNGSQA